mmetsp:Transcript_24614/g.70803  ORF Transcript_24614/g.70803 Transcript_24614/m.70803 type:complete len:208 (-) Transcript_24614:707-1330(-)
MTPQRRCSSTTSPAWATSPGTTRTRPATRMSACGASGGWPASRTSQRSRPGAARTRPRITSAPAAAPARRIWRPALWSVATRARGASSSTPWAARSCRRATSSQLAPLPSAPAAAPGGGRGPCGRCRWPACSSGSLAQPRRRASARKGSRRALAAWRWQVRCWFAPWPCKAATWTCLSTVWGTGAPRVTTLWPSSTCRPDSRHPPRS